MITTTVVSVLTRTVSGSDPPVELGQHVVPGVEGRLVAAAGPGAELDRPGRSVEDKGRVADVTAGGSGQPTSIGVGGVDEDDAATPSATGQTNFLT